MNNMLYSVTALQAFSGSIAGVAVMLVLGFGLILLAIFNRKDSIWKKLGNILLGLFILLSGFLLMLGFHPCERRVVRSPPPHSECNLKRSTGQSRKRIVWPGNGQRARSVCSHQAQHAHYVGSRRRGSRGSPPSPPKHAKRGGVRFLSTN